MSQFSVVTATPIIAIDKFPIIQPPIPVLNFIFRSFLVLMRYFLFTSSLLFCSATKGGGAQLDENCVKKLVKIGLASFKQSVSILGIFLAPKSGGSGEYSTYMKLFLTELQPSSYLDHCLQQIKGNVISDVVSRLNYFRRNLGKKMYEDPQVSRCGDAASGITLLLIDKMLGTPKTGTLLTMIPKSKDEIKSAQLTSCETAVFNRLKKFVLRHFIFGGELTGTCTGAVQANLEGLNGALTENFVVQRNAANCGKLESAMTSLAKAAEFTESLKKT